MNEISSVRVCPCPAQPRPKLRARLVMWIPSIFRIETMQTMFARFEAWEPFQWSNDPLSHQEGRGDWETGLVGVVRRVVVIGDWHSRES